MLALQGDAVRIFDDCYRLVDEVTALIQNGDDNSDERYNAIEIMRHARSNLDTMHKEGAYEMWRPIEQVHVAVDRLKSQPEFSRFVSLQKNGIAVSEMLDDIAAGLHVIRDFLDEQTRRSNGESLRSLSASQFDWEAEVEGEIKRVGNAIAVAGRALGTRAVREIQKLPAAPEFFDRFDRIQSLNINLRFAGRETRLQSTERLDVALEDVCAHFPSILSDEVDSELNANVKGAREIVRYLRLMLRRHNGLEDYPGAPHAEQVLAPFQFVVTDERLALQPQPSHPKNGSKVIAEAALTALGELAEDIELDLQNSNHPRLFRSFKRIVEAIKRDASVIEIGLHCSSFEGQINAASEELSNSLESLLSTYAESVKSYASQFVDWQRFSENAAEDRYSKEDAELFAKVARVLAADLEHRQSVDESVPTALWQAADWSDRADTPRTRLGVSRTVLNVIAACFNELVKKPAQAVLAVGGMVVTVIVLHHVLTFGVALSKTPEGAWLQPAMKVIERKLGELSSMAI